MNTMKTIQYSVAMQPNPLHEEDPKKAYASIQLTGVVSTDELAEHISDHNSVFSRGTIAGILTELSVCIRELLLQGYKVQLGTIGSFAPSITSLGALTMEDFTAQNITNVRVNFAPGKALQQLRRDAEFEQTTTRAAQAAALKAQKEGKTTADWTPKEEDEEDGSGEGGE